MLWIAPLQRLHAGEFDDTKVAESGLTRAQYSELLEPGLEWMLCRACQGADRPMLQVHPSIHRGMYTSMYLFRNL
jgi:hypothetical protein